MSSSVTSLAFNILSRYDGSGVNRARRDLEQLRKDADKQSSSINLLSGRLQLLGLAAAQLGPALAPVAASAAAGTASLTGLGVAAGGALGVFGLATFGAVKSALGFKKAISDAAAKCREQYAVLNQLTPGTAAYNAQLKLLKKSQMELNAASEALPASQRAFVNAVSGAAEAWQGFIKATSAGSLGVATTAVNAGTIALGKLAPVANAVAPIMQRVADSLKNWAAGPGLDRFINILISRGVPALEKMRQAGASVATAFGIMFRQSLPGAQGMAAAILRGANALKAWTSGGGFQRFLDYVAHNGPQVRQFMSALVSAIQSLVRWMAQAGPFALGLATSILRMVAVMNPATIQAFANGFLLLRSPFAFLLVNCPVLRNMIVSILGAMSPQAIYAIVAALVAWKLAVNNIVIATKAWAVVQFLLDFGALGPFLIVAGLVLLAVAAIAVAVYMVINHWQGFSGFFVGLWNGIFAFLKVIWSAILTGVMAFVSVLQAVWNTAWTVVKTVVQTAWVVIGPIVKAGIDFLVGIFNAAKATLTFIWDALWFTIRTMVALAWATIGPMVKAGWAAIQAIFNFFAPIVSGIWKTLWNTAKTVFDTAWRAIEAAAHAAWTAMVAIFHNVIEPIVSFWKGVWDHIQSIASGAWGALKSGIQGAVSGISNVWSTLKHILSEPIEFFVNTVYNDGLRRAWNDTVHKIPGVPEMPPAHFGGLAGGGPTSSVAAPGGRALLASGGLFSGYGGPTADRNLVGLSDREYVVNAASTKRFLPLLNAINFGGSGGGPHVPGNGYFLGGVVDVVKGAVGAVTGGVSGLLQGLGVDWGSGIIGDAAKKALDIMFTPFVSATNGIAGRFPGSGEWGKVPGHAISAAKDTIVNFVTGKAKSRDDKLGGAAKWDGKGASQWAPLVASVLAELHQPASDLAFVMQAIVKESGGNPNAINRTDINAQHGDPSIGLLQVIGSTFRAYAGPYVGLGQANPKANIYAAISYAASRYGAGWAQRMAAPGGYAQGGPVTLAANSFDQGGYLPRGLSLAYNGTGRPEPVGHDLGKGGGDVHYHYHFDGSTFVGGSQRDWEDLFVRTHKEVKRRRRIDA